MTNSTHTTPPNTVEEAPPLRKLVVYYEVLTRDPKTGEKSSYRMFTGKKGKTGKSFYPNVDFNLFSTKAKRVGKNFELSAPRRKYIRDYICDPSKKHAIPWDRLPAGKWYLLHDNGGRPFAVRLYRSKDSKKTSVGVYKRDPWSFIWQHEDPTAVKWYTHGIHGWKNVEKVFVGKSPLNPSTRYSGGYGKVFDGNSILLYLGFQKKTKTYRYAFLGASVMEFDFPERITSFVSPVGNNDVPYPTAYSQHYLVFFELEGGVYGDRKGFVRSKDQVTGEWNDLFDDYYGFGSYTKRQEEKRKAWKTTVKELPRLTFIHRRM